MDADKALTTTRSVRKRLDFEKPIDPAAIKECIEIALQSPSGSNRQGWHFVVVTDPEKIATISGYYRKIFDIYTKRPPEEQPQYEEGDPRIAQGERVLDSATYLAENMRRCPAMLIACLEGRPESPAAMAQAGFYGSIIPAAWSFMIAARVRGIGMAWTSMHLAYEKEVAELLGIPGDITQSVLLPMAYFTGDDFKPAQRLPLEQVTHWNSWGQSAP